MKKTGRKARVRKAQRSLQVKQVVVPPAAKSKTDQVGIVQPTPEQQLRVRYERGKVTNEMGQTIGVSYQRRPLIETMGAKGQIAPDELAALRYYRTAFDRCERSATKSCLNNDGSGGGFLSTAGFADIGIPASVLDAKMRLEICERVMGANVDTMRSVALHDLSFSQVAIQRFGGRDQEWIVEGEHRYKIVPKSGRHREIIREEFVTGLRALRRRLRLRTNMLNVVELWVEPREDGTATVEFGPCAPNRRYRLWGSFDDVSEVRFLLDQEFGKGHTYPTAKDAMTAVDAANANSHKSLMHLTVDEMAA